MNKTTFIVEKMDCPSEEQLVRIRLEALGNIGSLRFDIPHRELTVVHAESHQPILDALSTLGLGTRFVGSEPVDDGHVDEFHDADRSMLQRVLAINVAFFGIELVAGFVASSMGLVADSLDMLADSIIYGLALLAIGGTLSTKKRIARICGYFQLALALLGLAEVVRRFVGVDDTPSFQLMIVTSVFALLGNATSLYLLSKRSSNEAHLRASVICTSNDVIANAGVIAAGVAVLLTQSNVPDLLIGVVIFALVAWGALRILELGR
jgi:Co/Zn/Cd efflux system component